ncbi:MAG: ATP-binding protein [Actinoplanes sp.]
MSDLALAHLRLRLRPLHRALRAAADRRSALAARLERPDLTAYCVTEEQVRLLLDVVANPVDPASSPPAVDTEEQELRRTAAAAGATLPLDALATRLRLTRDEQDLLALVAAPEIDAAYERIFTYVVDDLNRRRPSGELIGAVLGRPAIRLCHEASALRRYGIVEAVAGATALPATEFRLGPGVLDLLLGWSAEVGLIAHDPDEIEVPAGFTAPPNCPAVDIGRLAAGITSGRLDLIGMWGAASTQRDAALALAVAAGRPLRTVTDPLPALRTAAALNAIVWVPADDLPGPAVIEALCRTRVPVIISGAVPWRPVPLLMSRSYAEITVPAPDHRQRRAAWSAALPQLGDDAVTELAVRFRMSGDELRAVAAVAGTGARFSGNGHPDRIDRHLPTALAAVTRGRTSGHVRAITPRRTADDLILPPEQLRRVLEIGSAFQAWPRVAETWGFGRRSSDAGVKALFTGDPGTGKTLSAEVLAGMLGLDLLKIDLSQVVSKWIGETEKNLESVFRLAEESQALMFFDEADALFGKRGDVRHGTDRYANLEVGYLLQRLEASDALVILASNLQENIDVAFTRRFHFVVNFARPGRAERQRLWRRAFPPEAPLARDVDVEALARLDMTGAAIVSAARSAALAAADGPGRDITMRDVVAGVARQFQREARLLRPADLGAYASLLDNHTRRGA